MSCADQNEHSQRNRWAAKHMLMLLTLRPKKLERLHALHHFVESVIELVMLSNAASQNRFEVGQISDVDDLIDALHKRTHGVVSSETVTEQNDEMLATTEVG